MDELLNDMQNKGLAEVATRCKYRGDLDLLKMIRLYDTTEPQKSVGNFDLDNYYPEAQCEGFIS